jgi:hypothetical protein
VAAPPVVPVPVVVVPVWVPVPIVPVDPAAPVPVLPVCAPATPIAKAMAKVVIKLFCMRMLLPRLAPLMRLLRLLRLRGRMPPGNGGMESRNLGRNSAGGLAVSIELRGTWTRCANG